MAIKPGSSHESTAAALSSQNTGGSKIHCLSRRCSDNPRRTMASQPHEFRTERLLLRRWCRGDRESFAALNADPLVMKHFPSPLSRQESNALVERAEAIFEQNGFGPWAVEVLGIAPFIGFVGLSIPRF